MNPTKSPPLRTDENVILAAYNIKWLGQQAHDLQKLAKVVSHFDVCGVLEVKQEEELHSLLEELRDLGEGQWGLIYGCRSQRPGGIYHEAYGILYRTDRVTLGDGLASNIWDKDEVFRNDPYVATFTRGEFTFAMGLVHTRWSSDAEGDREGEVEGMADQIVRMREFIPTKDFILAGDFNYSATASQMVSLSENANLKILDNNAKSTFKTDGSGFASAYDHLLIGDIGKTTGLRQRGVSTTLDVCHLIYGDNEPGNMILARRELSDHLPVFAEFTVT